MPEDDLLLNRRLVIWLRNLIHHRADAIYFIQKNDLSFLVIVILHRCERQKIIQNFLFNYLVAHKIYLMKLLLPLIFLSAISFALPAQNFYVATPAAKHWVDSVFDKLSIKERIAQLFVLRLSEQTQNGVVFHNTEVENAIKKYNIGAICLFQGSPVQQADFINHFQSIAKTPMLITIDDETGLGMRMRDSVMKFPDQLTLGALQDASIIYKIGNAIGNQCKRAGIQVSFAPVVDINNNPDNPVIGFRSFGEDKYKVALFGTQIMRGIQDAGVMACAKHFPGHGDVSVDSHFDLPVITKSMQQLDSLELYPFKELFKAGVGSVMIAHLSIAAIDTTQHLPTSLSKNNVTGLLRNTMGFNGISFTDALEMKGVSKYYPDEKGSLQSLIAGNDMLCLPGNVPASIDAIYYALRKGYLDEDDINARVKKVLLAKYNLGLNNIETINTNNLTNDLNTEVPALRSMVAEHALTLLNMQTPRLLPLDKKNSIAYLGIGLNNAGALAGSLQKDYNADVFYFDYKDGAAKANSIYKSLQSKYDLVIIGIHKYSKYPANNFGITDDAINLVKKIQQSEPNITLVFGNPYAIKNFCTSPNLAECYEDDVVFQQAAYNWLQGKFFAEGKLPVTVCDAYKAGSGITVSNALPIVAPESAGMHSDVLNRIDSIATDAIQKHATPGCVVLVARDGKVVFDKAYGYLNYNNAEPVTTATVYDLASVTKVSATTVSVMKLFEEGKLDIQKTIGDYLPWVQGTDKANLTLWNILLHQAGLTPYIPFYKEVIDSATGIPFPGLFKNIPDEIYSVHVADNMYMRSDWVDTMYARILQSNLGSTGKYIYSDNDFIFLGKIVEQITGMSLDEYAKQNFYDPLKMLSTRFKPAEQEPLSMIAPTEKEKYFRMQLLRGNVHDPGSAMFGGVAGHAGLFSNAYDLAKLYQMLLNGGEINGTRFLKKETIDYFTAYHGNNSRRGLGFDKPEKDNATRKEPYPCISASPQTFGHTGFTGTCVWVDPKYDLVFIFLSNRVCPDGGDNKKLGDMNVRGNIQEVVYQSIIDK